MKNYLSIYLLLFALLFSCTGGGGDTSSPDSTQPTSSNQEGIQETEDNSIKFVAAGFNGTIITSVDGVDWIAQNSGVTEHFYKVKYINNLIFALGANGTFLKSTDAINWESINVGSDSYLQDVVFHEGLYVVVGGSDSNSGTNSIILTSTDLSNWTRYVANTARELNGIIYYKERFQLVAGGGTNVTGNSIGNSTDGVSWAFTGTNYSQNRPLYSLVQNATHVFAVGSDGMIIKSNDYFNWETIDYNNDSSISGANFTEIIFENNTFIIVGRSPHIILTSTDGSTWSEFSIDSGEDLNGVTYGHSKYVAVGDNGVIYYSENAQEWSSSSPVNSNLLYSVTVITD